MAGGLEEGEWHGMLDDSANYVCTYQKGVSKGGVTKDKRGKRYTFTMAITEPTFKGGIEGFYKFLAQNIKYPIAAKENSIQGKITLGFVVEKDGTLANVKVLQGIGGGCDEEAVRVINISPPWLPGMQYGIPVRVPCTVPITFTVTIDNN
jgi:TonB family protein